MVTKRKGDKTRRRLLEVAFEVISRQGFQAAGLNEILELTGLTKGAIYHHFSDKTAMGYAVVDEIVDEIITTRWIVPLGAKGDPLAMIPKAMRAVAAKMNDSDIALGCPLGNLAAEMSALDDGFARRIDAIYQKWRDAVAASLAAGDSVIDNPQRIATFIVATLAGCLAQAKLLARRDILLDGVTELEFYLRQLGPEPEPEKPKYAPAPKTEMEDYLL